MNDAEEAVHNEMKGYSIANKYPGRKWRTEWFEIEDKPANVMKVIFEILNKWITAEPGAKIKQVYG